MLVIFKNKIYSKDGKAMKNSFCSNEKFVEYCQVDERMNFFDYSNFKINSLLVS